MEDLHEIGDRFCERARWAETERSGDLERTCGYTHTEAEHSSENKERNARSLVGHVRNYGDCVVKGNFEV